MSSMASMLGPFLVEHFWRWDTGVAPRWSYPLGGEPTRLLASPSSRVEFVFLRMGFHSSNVQTLTRFIAASPGTSWSIQMSVERGVSWTAECKIVFTSSYLLNWFVDFFSKVGRIGSSYSFLRLDGLLKNVDVTLLLLLTLLSLWSFERLVDVGSPAIVDVRLCRCCSCLFIMLLLSLLF